MQRTDSVARGTEQHWSLPLLQLPSEAVEGKHGHD